MPPKNDIGTPPVRKIPYPEKLVPTKDEPIAITGANGFLGSHIVEQLLDAGYSNLRCGVLGYDQHIRDMDKGGNKLQFYTINLLDASKFDPLFQGCRFVIHCAAPVDPGRGKDPLHELIEPTVRGMNNVLESCVKNGVKKIVITSSTGAIMDEPLKVYNEEDWNWKSHLDRMPYWYSKAKSEKLAWEFADSHPELQVVTILPTTFMGPYHNPNGFPESVREIYKLITADVDPNNAHVFHVSFVSTDVRDVAHTHKLVLENPETYGRYLCACNNNIWQSDVIKLLLQKFPIFKNRVPKKKMDSQTFKTAFQNSPDAQVYITHLDRLTKYDNSRIKQHLGVGFIDFESSLYDTILCLITRKHVKVTPEEYENYVKMNEERMKEFKSSWPISANSTQSNPAPSSDDEPAQEADTPSESNDTSPPPPPPVSTPPPQPTSTPAPAAPLNNSRPGNTKPSSGSPCWCW